MDKKKKKKKKISVSLMTYFHTLNTMKFGNIFFQERFGSGSQNLGAIIEATTAHFSTEFDYRKVKAFFKSRRKFVGSGRRALDQVILFCFL